MWSFVLFSLSLVVLKNSPTKKKIERKFTSRRDKKKQRETTNAFVALFLRAIHERERIVVLKTHTLSSREEEEEEEEGEQQRQQPVKTTLTMMSYAEKAKSGLKVINK